MLQLQSTSPCDKEPALHPLPGVMLLGSVGLTPFIPPNRSPPFPVALTCTIHQQLEEEQLEASHPQWGPSLGACLCQ